MMPVLKTCGLLRVVLSNDGGESFHILFEGNDPQAVRRRYKAACKKHGHQHVEMVNRNGYVTGVQRTGGGRSTCYFGVRSCDVTDDGKIISTLLRVVESPSQTP